MPVSDLWKREFHQKGFMGFVDGFWVFCQRVSMILFILSLCSVIAIIAYGYIRGRTGLIRSRIRANRRGQLGSYRNQYT